MIEFDVVSIICTIINLLVLFLLVKKFLFKPVNDILEKRQELVNESIASADQKKKEAEELKLQYENALGSAKEESSRIMTDAQKRAQTEYERVLAKADREAEKRLARAKEDIAMEKDRSLRELEGQITELVLDTAEKVIGKEVSEEENQKLFDEFLSDAGEV